MEKRLLILCFIAASFSLSAQDYSRKPGKVTDYELRMTSYEADTAAAAVILCETTTINYMISVSITSRRYYYMKAKVLKREGTDVGDIEILHYVSTNSREGVSGISASSFNLVDGKPVESQLKKQYIFTEQVSEKWRKVKFSVPDVKVGSVVEVRYMIESNMPDQIDPIEFQHSYPVVYAHAAVTIPEYFKFHLHTQGYYPLKITNGTSSGSYNAGPITETYTQKVVDCTAEEVPALKDEPQVWCPSDFRSSLHFELAGYDFPGSIYEPVSSTWEAVNDLLDKSSFRSNLRVGNPFKPEVAAILASTPDEMDRLCAIHKLVTSRMAWNEKYRLVSDGVRSAADQGTGSSADINFALNAALKAAGFQTTPILLNPRHYGRLPTTRPSIDKINAFIIRVTLADGSPVYLDGTNKYSGPNVLPPALMVDRARIYGDKTQEGWVDLTKPSSNTLHSILFATMGPSGKIEGQITKTYANVMAMNKMKAKAEAASEEKYIEKLEEEDHLEISDYAFTQPKAQTAEEKYSFSLNASKAGDFIYLNASVIPFMSQNPLSQQERQLPIEFSSPDTYVIVCNVMLPAGYVIDELPKPSRLTACDGGVSFLYIATGGDGVVQVSLRYDMKRILYSMMEYHDLRAFFGMIASLSTSNIVLKKAS